MEKQKETTPYMGTNKRDDSREKLLRVRDYSKKQEIPRPRAQVDTNDVNVGTKVTHKKWGIGTIVQIKDRNNDKEIVIAFDKVGLKRLLLSIAPIEIVKGE
jgi:DNA helicase-2/ATP-dependent DNA helicase PcrA